MRPQVVNAAKVALSSQPANPIDDRKDELARLADAGHLLDFAYGVRELASGRVERLRAADNEGPITPRQE